MFHAVEVPEPAFPRRWAVAASLAAVGTLVAGVWMAGPLPRPELPAPEPADTSFTYPDFPNLPETGTRRSAPIETKTSLRARIGSLNAAELQVMLAHELAHGHRPRVLRAINARFEELRG